MLEEDASDRLPYRRVLVVEDDRALLELLTDYLELRGLEVVAVETGAEAWRELESEAPPDAVMLDLRIPGLSGDEVLQRIRSDPRLAHIPVAVMTGLRPGEFHLAAHPDVLLSKPFDFETLGAALSEMGQSNGPSRGLGAAPPVRPPVP